MRSNVTSSKPVSPVAIVTTPLLPRGTSSLRGTLWFGAYPLCGTPTVWYREIQKKRVEIRRRINYPPEPGRRPAEGLGREVVSPQPRGRPPPGCSAPPTPRLPCAYRGPRRRAFPELRPAS